MAIHLMCFASTIWRSICFAAELQKEQTQEQRPNLPQVSSQTKDLPQTEVPQVVDSLATNFTTPETPTTLNTLHQVPDIEEAKMAATQMVVSSETQKKLPYISKPTEPSNYEPYLTSFNLGSITIADDFIIYGSTIQRDKYYIPLSFFAKYTQIPLEEKGDLLVGWFLKENNKIEINTKTGVVKIGNATYQFTAQDAVILYTELLVSIEMLAQLFPMEMKFDLSQQVLNVETKTPFPIEQALARQEALGNINKDKNPDDEELKKAKLEVQEYQQFSMPNIDMTYSNAINSQTFKMNQNLSFTSTSHLLKSILNVTGSVVGNSDQFNLNSMKASLRRNDSISHPFEHYLHPKQYWVGDIATTPANLISSATTGIGASVSNIPAGWKIDFNNLQITGYAIPNWSVEIYLNNNLLNFSTVDLTGFYLFSEIPLSAGLNTVKLVFYGPFGQSREVIQKVNLSSSLLQKGKIGYEFSTVKERTSIIPTASSIPKADDQTYDTQRYFGNIRYGIGNETSLAIGMTSYMKNFTGIAANQAERQNYLSSSITTSLFGIIVNTDFAYHLNSHEGAAKFSLNAPVFKESNLFVSSQIFTEKFISETRPQANEAAQKSLNEIRIKNGIKLFGKFVVGTYSLKVNTLNSGNANYTLDAQNSITFIKSLSLANSLQTSVNQNGNQVVKSTTGSANLTFKSEKGFLLRGTVNYTPLFAQTFFTTSSFSANYNRGLFGTTSTYNMNLVTNQGTYMIGLNVNSKYITTSFQLGTDKSISANININFNKSVIFDGIKPKISQSGAASGGIIAVSAFMDANNNGKWDFDEVPAKDVAIKTSGNSKKELTNAKGQLLLTGLPSDSAFLFDADTGMMPDISVQPAQSVKRKIILKAGAPHKILVPIVKIIDIEGTLVVQMNDEKIPVSNATIQLIDKSNKIIDTTTTTPDGYYIFSRVVQGTYKVRASKETIEKYKKYLLNK